MVQNGVAKCRRRTLSGVEEKAISEDEKPCTEVLHPDQNVVFHIFRGS